MRYLGLTEIILGTLIIEAAERSLGPLSEGQMVDLLLDNMPGLEGSQHARELLELVAQELERKPGEPLIVHGSRRKGAGK